MALVDLLRGHRVAVALSGGADSVALVFWLRDHVAVARHGVNLAGLIHVNHTLRGDESERDEAFCRALAVRLGLPIDVTRVDVAAEARAAHRSREASARRARYRVFREASARLGATRVATAHTADDQAETVLLRLLRGAGSRGVSGIRTERGLYVRPLLDRRRAELRASLRALGETFCEDSTNADVAIARNRIRHELLPVIERIAPGAVNALARFASLSADDETFLARNAIEEAATVVLSIREGSGTGRALAELDARALNGLSPAIARRVVRAVVEQLVPDTTWTVRHIEAALALARRQAGGGHLDLPGVTLERVGGRLWLREGRPVAVAPFARTLDGPGTLDLPAVGRRVTVTCGAGALTGDAPGEADEAVALRAGTLTWPLTVRNRRPGDRVRLAGAAGGRKLQDVLTDRKVPRSERDRVVLVVDGSGRIVWVAGVGVAEACRVEVPGESVVILRITELELA